MIAKYNAKISGTGHYVPDKIVNNFEDAKTSNLERFSAYYKGMRETGIYIAPSQFEAGFVSAAHSNEDIENTVKAASAVFKSLN